MEYKYTSPCLVNTHIYPIKIFVFYKEIKRDIKLS